MSAIHLWTALQHQIHLHLRFRRVRAQHGRRAGARGLEGFLQTPQRGEEARHPHPAPQRAQPGAAAGQGRAGAQRGAAAGGQQRLAVAVDDRHLLRRELLAQALQRQRGGAAGPAFDQRLRGAAGAALGQLLGRPAGALRQFVDQRIERAAAEVEAGVERALHLHVEPALDAARDELVADRVDEQARQHADQREDRRQLEQQPAAELAPPYANDQPHRRDADPARAAPPPSR